MKAIVRRLPIPLIVGVFLLFTQTGWFDGAIKIWGGDDEPVYMSEDNPWTIGYEKKTGAPAVYFANCAQAHASGQYSIRRGRPGYRPELDADGDGRACEPYRGRYPLDRRA